MDLEQLPAYEEATSGGARREAPRIQRPVPVSPNGGRERPRAPLANNGVVGLSSEANARPAEGEVGANPMPDESPPGYEEAQGSSTGNMERGMEKMG